MGLANAAKTAPDRERFVVELDFVDDAGSRQRAPLAMCWNIAFEHVTPVRNFHWSKGQKHCPGWWWSPTSDRHVAYESWLERGHAMLLDYGQTVVGFASQPFRLHWPDKTRWRRHAPDLFARCADGTGVVIDVRADDRIEEGDAEAFEVTARACTEVGWAFRRVGAVDPLMAANLRWLSHYRHPATARILIWSTPSSGRSPSRPRCSPERSKPGTALPCCRWCSTCSGPRVWSRT